ncbi:hypothetical protein C8P68_106368 [Mucilaginibacter yixingensis]|uniref:PH (Pleckstrin Homology) domain-containing protein n=1 Tax=Mucilaginibacter yixingensis TaxID=1295612 RepID=A0A2T5J7P0_9SPHI|nr:hypothetical protein [Mucilaginibacter yixingensis]PTQ95153.1 hypothetical protein C8P68_106368 [Mucilaginibacter yixingensis]
MRLSNTKIVVANPIPPETSIYFYGWSVLFELILFVLFLCAAALVFILSLPGKEVFSLAVLLIMGLCLLFSIYGLCKALLRDGPQIIISNGGIQTANSAFYKWDEITGEYVFETSGRGKKYYLDFNGPEGKVRILLNNLNISADGMGILLHFYRQRHINPDFKY